MNTCTKNQLNKMLEKGKRGFTILELIVVIAVIGTIMSLMFFGGRALMDNSKVTAMKSDLRNFEIMLKNAVTDNPDITSKTDLEAALPTLNRYFEDELTFTKDTNADSQTKDLYVTERLDPWGSPYIITFANTSDGSTHTGVKVMVISKGQNKVTGENGKVDLDEKGVALELKDSVVKTKQFDLKDLAEDETVCGGLKSGADITAIELITEAE